MNVFNLKYYITFLFLAVGINIYTQCNANAGNDATIDCNTTSVTLNGSGGVSYSWSPSTGLDDPDIANPVATPTSTTEYILTVTGADGCTEDDTVIVVIDSVPPTVDAGLDDTINCIDLSVNLNATGGASYSWYPSVGLDNPNIANPVATPNTTTEYIVTATGSNGCTKNDTVIVVIDSVPPPINAGLDDTINCIDLSVNLNAIGGASYSWSPSGGLDNPNISNPVATPNITTEYIVTATGSNGCTKNDTIIVVIDNLPPVANAGNDETIDCNTPTTTLNATGGVSYSWSPSTGLSNSFIQNPVANPSTNTTYTVLVRGQNGCEASDNVTITVDKDPPIANAGPDFGTTCAALSAQLSASGGISYSWSPTTALSNPNIANPIASPSTTTIYTVTVKGTNGCTDTDYTTVNLNDVTPTSNAGIDQELCGIYTTSLAPDISNNASSDYFTWGSDPLNPTIVSFSDLNDPNATVSNLQEGVYTIYWTVSNNVCPPVQDTMTITVFDPPIANAGINDSLCSDDNINLAAILPIGSSWGEWSVQTDFSNPNPNNIVFADNSINNTNVSGLEEGVYSFIWTVFNGICTEDKDTVLISVFNQPTSNAGSDIDLCNIYNTSLNATVPTGTTEGFWYLDNNFNNPSSVILSDSSIVNSNVGLLQEGTYQFIWETYNGNCPIARDSMFINVFDTPISNAGNDVSVCGIDSLNLDTLLFLNANFPAGTSEGVWSLDNSFSNPSTAIFIDGTSNISKVTNLLEGTYQFVWTVSNGSCRDSSDTLIVTAFDSPYTNAGNDIELCGIYDVQLAAHNTIGSSTGEWSVDANFNNPSVITFDNPSNPNSNSTGYIEGVYQFIWTVSNSNCTPKNDTVKVFVYDTPIANAGIDIEVCNSYNVSFMGVDPVGLSSGVWSEDLNFNNPSSITLLDDTLNTTQGSGYTEGVYQFIWTVYNGVCNEDKDTLQVRIYNMPVSNAGQDQILCDVDTIQLNGGGNIGTADGTWIIDSTYNYNNVPIFRDSSDSNSMADGFIVGEYPLIFMVKNGVCPISYDTVFIVNKPKPIANFDFPTMVCDNKCFDITSLSTAPNNETITLEWFLGNNTYTDSISFACLDNVGKEDIKLVVSASNGCKDSIISSNAITVNPSPTANFDFSFNSDSLLELQRLDVENMSSSDVVSFMYYMGNGDTLYDENLIYIYKTNGLYDVNQWVENQFGCRDSITKAIYVGKRRAIYVPNTFTPNGDGINDLFGPISRDLSEDFYEFTISNRLGKVFFRSNTIDEKWNGKIDGKYVQDGAFIWSLKFIFVGDTEVKTKEGHLIILK